MNRRARTIAGGLGAAVTVAFVGTAALGVGPAQAAGIARGLSYAAEPGPRPGAPPRPAAHPANLPPAMTTAVRYAVRDGELAEL
ncbi:hypothetical protein [Intrasporangium sp. DVR]|uniref:hypothetical protein n=1 Tax=Intrasporangium sp. DVR TaxID=3127867 RepID=UPI00313A508C